MRVPTLVGIPQVWQVRSGNDRSDQATTGRAGVSYEYYIPHCHRTYNDCTELGHEKISSIELKFMKIFCFYTAFCGQIVKFYAILFHLNVVFAVSQPDPTNSKNLRSQKKATYRSNGSRKSCRINFFSTKTRVIRSNFDIGQQIRGSALFHFFHPIHRPAHRPIKMIVKYKVCCFSRDDKL